MVKIRWKQTLINLVKSEFQEVPNYLRNLHSNFKYIKPSETFGHLEVLGVSHIKQRRDGGVRIYYICICKCGNIVSKEGIELRRETTNNKVCNTKCPIIKNRHKLKYIKDYVKYLPGTMIEDLRRRRFGRLLVIEYSHKHKDGEHYWVCECDCKNSIIVGRSSLTGNHTRSCGCYREDRKLSHKLNTNIITKYIYQTWIKIKSRCYTKTTEGYGSYGGKGIGIYSEWKDDPEKFVSDILNSIGPKSYRGYHMDRISPRKDYEPKNIRWLHPEQNMASMHKHNNHHVYLGVLRINNITYKASIGSKFIGYFNDPILAAEKYDKEALLKYDNRYIITNVSEGYL